MSIILYGHPLSANVHRARLVLSFLELPYEERPVDLAAYAQREPAYLAKNPMGQLPTLDDDGKVLVDSHAIAVYLVRRYGDESLLPRDPFEEARVLGWLFLDANEIHNGIGYARNHYRFGIPGDGAGALSRAKRVLGVLDGVLHDREWLELDRPTLADIGCAPLVACAGDARVSLSEYPNVERWLTRFQRLPRYVPMPSRDA